MSQSIPSFQRYQQAFTAHIRDPLNHPRPEGVPAERMAVYEEIVFNNLLESISACFPIARQVCGKRLWSTLAHAFLRDHSAGTPLFRKIPEEFLSYMANASPEVQQLLPPYLSSLCHYEWIELLVATMPAAETAFDPNGDLMAHQPVFTPTMQLLSYDYAVHRISRRNQPKEMANTRLLVYRNHAEDVKFMELNPVTYRLLELLQEIPPYTGKQALTLIAGELNHPEPEKIILFGGEILEELKSQGVILGSKLTHTVD